MTTSSRKQPGILPVRLGIEPDNKTALRELGMDESLTDSMSDRELDELIIEKEYERVKEYYSSNGEDGEQYATDWKREALRKINDN